MRLKPIVKFLDTCFETQSFVPDSSFESNVRATYASVPELLPRYATPQFLIEYSGLMLSNSPEVFKIYTVVFLSREILDKVLELGNRNVLVITHHPLEMETSDRGFLPLPEPHFEAMRSNAASVYSLHDPLDVHKGISTSRALSSALGVVNQQPFVDRSPGCVGIYGDVEPLSLGEFLRRVTSVTGVSDLHCIPGQQVVKKVGIVAGEVDALAMLEAEQLGCDTYLTGTYYNRVNNSIGADRRRSFEEVKHQVNMNIIECSHYASESIVMRRDLPGYLENSIGIATEFIEQSDPWY